MFESALALHLVVQGVVPVLLLLAPRAAPVNRRYMRVSTRNRVPGMPGRVASDVLLTPSARISSSLGRRIAPDIALPGLGADRREGCDAAASRAPGGIATGKLTAQTSTKVDDALDEALA